jgi:hypothetical protein
MSNGIPILSREGTREILEEMSKPPADTPERRATIDAVREMLPQIEESLKRMHRAKRP